MSLRGFSHGNLNDGKDRGKMKFFIRFFITLVVLFLLWSGVVLGQGQRATQTSQWVFDVYKKKKAYAQSIDEKKIVILSGSNALFGINSKMLEDAFGVKVVNYGVNAGVLLPYMLYKSKEIIKPKDVVILPLEYHVYTYDGTPNTQMIDTIFSRDIDFFYALTPKEQFLTVWNITLERILAGYEAKGGTPVNSGLYGAHNVDARGDQIGATAAAKNEYIEKELDALMPNNYGKIYKKDALAWYYLEEFVSWCDARDVKVVFMPTTMLFFDVYKKDSKERWFYENIAKEVEAKGWSFVGEPYEYMYTKEHYFNTDFHLTSEARDMRTKQMIADLAASGEIATAKASQ
jgi:hypothetical protein